MLHKKYFHGSTSASLPGVFDAENPGLAPFRTLLQEGKVPFCGELWYAFRDGEGGQGFISAVSGVNFGASVEYSLRANAWYPEKNNTKKLEEAIQRQEEKGDPGMEGFFIVPAKSALDIERRRINAWPSLSDEEQNLILNPFPVIYGIETENESRRISSDYRGERGFLGRIPLEDLTLFIPSSKVGLVRQFIASREYKTPVHEFNELASLARRSISNQYAVEKLLREAE